MTPLTDEEAEYRRLLGLTSDVRRHARRLRDLLAGLEAAPKTAAMLDVVTVEGLKTIVWKADLSGLRRRLADLEIVLDEYRLDEPCVAERVREVAARRALRQEADERGRGRRRGGSGEDPRLG